MKTSWSTLWFIVTIFARDDDVRDDGEDVDNNRTRYVIERQCTFATGRPNPSRRTLAPVGCDTRPVIGITALRADS